MPYPLDVHNWRWVKVLRPYFEKHTTIGAALIAGFVGAITAFIMSFIKPRYDGYYPPILVLLSGLIGIPMRYSGLFPHLNDTYYKDLGFTTSLMTDAFSGIVVASSIFLINYLQRLKNV